jgi:8-oxo-dGTP diphosphatase
VSVPPAAVPREVRVPKQVTRLGVYAMCVDGTEDAARVLLCRIAPGYPAAGFWTLPGGGVEFGEDPNRALIRELEEETGLAARPDGLLGVWSRHFAPTETHSGDELHFVGIVYRAELAAGELRVEVGGSTDAVAWFSRAEVEAAEIGDLARYGLSLLPGWA